MNGLYTLTDLDANLVEALSNRATELRRGATPANYEGLALGLLFLAPSLRTQASMQRAAQLLGLDLIQLQGSSMWGLETDEGVVHASTTHIQALVNSTADEAVQAVEAAVDPAPAAAATEAPRASFVENAAQISPIVAPASVLSPAEPASPAVAQPTAAVVAWPGAGAN